MTFIRHFQALATALGHQGTSVSRATITSAFAMASVG